MGNFNCEMPVLSHVFHCLLVDFTKGQIAFVDHKISLNCVRAIRIVLARY